MATSDSTIQTVPYDKTVPKQFTQTLETSPELRSASSSSAPSQPQKQNTPKIQEKQEKQVKQDIKSSSPVSPSSPIMSSPKQQASKLHQISGKFERAIGEIIHDKDLVVDGQRKVVEYETATKGTASTEEMKRYEEALNKAAGKN